MNEPGIDCVSKSGVNGVDGRVGDQPARCRSSRAAKRDAAGIRPLDTGRVTKMGRWQPRLNRLGLKDVRRLQCPMRGFIPTCSKADR